MLRIRLTSGYSEVSPALQLLSFGLLGRLHGLHLGATPKM